MDTEGIKTGGSRNWTYHLKRDMEPNWSSDDRGGEDGAGWWHWAPTGKVCAWDCGSYEMTSGFLFCINMGYGCFSASAWSGQCRRRLRCSEVLCYHVCRDVTETTTETLAAAPNATCPHPSRFTHGALNLCDFKGDRLRAFFLQLTQNGYSDPSCGEDQPRCSVWAVMVSSPICIITWPLVFTVFWLFYLRTAAATWEKWKESENHWCE